jgi:hypothetical protein
MIRVRHRRTAQPSPAQPSPAQPWQAPQGGATHRKPSKASMVESFFPSSISFSNVPGFLSRAARFRSSSACFTSAGISTPCVRRGWVDGVTGPLQNRHTTCFQRRIYTRTHHVCCRGIAARPPPSPLLALLVRKRRRGRPRGCHGRRRPAGPQEIHGLAGSLPAGIAEGSEEEASCMVIMMMMMVMMMHMDIAFDILLYIIASFDILLL